MHIFTIPSIQQNDDDLNENDRLITQSSEEVENFNMTSTNSSETSNFSNTSNYMMCNFFGHTFKNILDKLKIIYILFLICFFSVLIVNYKLFNFKEIYILFLFLIIFHLFFIIYSNRKITIYDINIKNACLQLTLSVKSILIMVILSQIIILNNQIKEKLINNYKYSYYILNIYFYYCCLEIITILVIISFN